MGGGVARALGIVGWQILAVGAWEFGKWLGNRRWENRHLTEIRRQQQEIDALDKATQAAIFEFGCQMGRLEELVRQGLACDNLGPVDRAMLVSSVAEALLNLGDRPQMRTRVLVRLSAIDSSFVREVEVFMAKAENGYPTKPKLEAV